MNENKNGIIGNKKVALRAIKDSFLKLSPKTQIGNPVMFLVYLSAILTSILFVLSLAGIQDASSGYTLGIAIILWFTVLFANFAEAIAEGRGKAQADSLRSAKKDVEAHKIPSLDKKEKAESVSSATLKKGDLVLVNTGEQIPADGEVIEGAASVDESAITGESAPVVREAGGDRSAVTGGTTVISDWLVIQVTSEAGESFLDKMIAMVEGSARKKTPNEIALQIFLIALTVIFLLVTVSLYSYAVFFSELAGIKNPISVTSLPDFSPMDFYLDLSSSQVVQELCEDYILRENPEHFVAEIVRLVKPLYGEAADKSGGGSGQKSPIVEEARAYIRQNVNKKFSLQELAEAIHVSPYYLVRLFKKEMGVTPNQYYIQTRMYHAKKELLLRPSEADVAMELNFTDQSHLCNQFRRQMGISPGDYRKNFQRL